MADKITGYTFDKMRVTPAADSLMYHHLDMKRDKWIQGYKGNITPRASGLNVIIDTGAAIIKGRLVEILEPITLSIPANTMGFIVIEIDLTKTNTATGTPGSADYTPVNNQVTLKYVDAMVQQDITNGGQIYQYPIAGYSSNGSSVTLYNAETNRYRLKQAPGGNWKSYYDDRDLLIWDLGNVAVCTGYITRAKSVSGTTVTDAFLYPKHLRPLSGASYDLNIFVSEKIYNLYITMADDGNTGLIRIGRQFNTTTAKYETAATGGWYTLNGVWWPIGGDDQGWGLNNFKPYF